MKRKSLFLFVILFAIGFCFFIFKWNTHKNIEIKIPELVFNSFALAQTKENPVLRIEFRIRAQCELGMMDLLELDWHDSKSAPFFISLESIKDDNLRITLPMTLGGIHKEQKLPLGRVPTSGASLVGVFLCSGATASGGCKNKRAIVSTIGILENLQQSKFVSERRYSFHPLVLGAEGPIWYLNVGNLHDNQLPALRTQLSRLLEIDSESQKSNLLIDWLKLNMNVTNGYSLETHEGALVVSLGKHEASLCEK